MTMKNRVKNPKLIHWSQIGMNLPSTQSCRKLVVLLLEPFLRNG